MEITDLHIKHTPKAVVVGDVDVETSFVGAEFIAVQDAEAEFTPCWDKPTAYVYIDGHGVVPEGSV